MATCNICAETYNKKRRVIIECPCGFKCCKVCCETYLLSAEVNCMSCKTDWTHGFLLENFSKKFLKQYREHRAEVLFNREVHVLKELQPEVEKEIKIYNIDNQEKELQKQIKELQKQKEKIRNEKEKIRNESISTTSSKCPNNHCLGFLSENKTCNLCGVEVCRECREIKEGHHKCNEDILKNIKTIEKDSKPCPKCSSLINKIDGCDQMYCVKCKTVFSWSTLNIEGGKIHNPHYYEEQLRLNNGIIPRDPLDVVGGRQLDQHLIRRLEEQFQKLPDGWTKRAEHVPLFGEIRNLYIGPKNEKLYVHPQASIVVLIAKYVEHQKNNLIDGIPDFLNNRDIWKGYLKKWRKEDDVKKALIKREEARKKSFEVRDIQRKFYNEITDILYRALEEKKELYEEIENKRLETNEILARYASKYMIIPFDMVTLIERTLFL